MKGLMKNFRFIFQMFEEEEEEEKEMQIGLPTDVKHVAHIGWDGPSVNSPSWMEDFKSAPPENTSSTVAKGDTDKGVEETDNWGSQESITKKGVKESSGRNLPTLPKSSRRQPSIDSIESADSPVESPTQKSKPSKRRSKKKESNNSRELETSNSNELPNIPKKSRRKKSKDNDGSVKSSSSKSREKGSRHVSRYESDDGSVSKKYDD